MSSGYVARRRSPARFVFGLEVIELDDVASNSAESGDTLADFRASFVRFRRARFVLFAVVLCVVFIHFKIPVRAVVRDSSELGERVARLVGELGSTFEAGCGVTERAESIVFRPVVQAVLRVRKRAIIDAVESFDESIVRFVYGGGDNRRDTRARVDLNGIFFTW